uniref:Uncharacterized protein n=1 Tax=Romanomermis culicivorax TaxID=13658 RepID=A0A915JQL2_ROMCU
MKFKEAEQNLNSEYFLRHKDFQTAASMLCLPKAILEQHNPVASTSISDDHASSKDIDNGLRLAVLIHVIKHALLKALRIHDMTIPKVRETFLRAVELVTILKKQMSSYKIAVFEDCSKLPTLDERKHGIIFEKQSPDIRSQWIS